MHPRAPPPPNPFKWCPTFLGQIVCFTHHEVHNRVSKLPAIPNVASDGIPLKVTQLWWLRLWYFRLSPMITEVIFSHCCKTEIIKPQGKRSLSCPRSTQSSPSRIGICTFSKGGTVNSQYHKGQQCFIRSCRSHRRRMFGFFSTLLTKGVCSSHLRGIVWGSATIKWRSDYEHKMWLCINTHTQATVSTDTLICGPRGSPARPRRQSNPAAFFCALTYTFVKFIFNVFHLANPDAVCRFDSGSCRTGVSTPKLSVAFLGANERMQSKWWFYLHVSQRRFKMFSVSSHHR